MNIFVFLILQAGTSATTAAAPLPSQGSLLWRDFRAGMTPEQFGDTLRKVDGIKTVQVTRKGAKPPKIKVDYVYNTGIEIGSLKARVGYAFDNNALTSINLVETDCWPAMAARLEKVGTALGEKYSKSETIKVVDKDDVAQDRQQAFFNDDTRVTVSLTPVPLELPVHQYGGTGLVGSMQKLTNSLADSAYQSALNACPDRSGLRATILIHYESQPAWIAQHGIEETNRANKAKETKNGL
jgi:hypothetical protein